MFERFDDKDGLYYREITSSVKFGVSVDIGANPSVTISPLNRWRPIYDVDIYL